jgi:hypothetical protein
VWVPSSDTATFEPGKWIERLNAGRVKYVIVGDIALESHGVRAEGSSRDLDIVPELTEANLLRLVMTLREFGAELDRGGLPREAADDPFYSAHSVEVGANEPLPSDLFERVGGHEGAVTFTSQFGEVNVYPTPRGAPNFASLDIAGTRTEFLGAPVTVASLSDLRRIKDGRAPERDLEDLAAIDAFAAALPRTEPTRPTLSLVQQADSTIGSSAADSGRVISLQEALARVKGIDRSSVAASVNNGSALRSGAAVHHALKGRTVPGLGAGVYAGPPTATERILADIASGHEAPVLARELDNALRPSGADDGSDLSL